MFSKSAFSVLRRYSDFLWLYETLSMNNPGVVVPPVPEKSPFGRFDDQFVQQRRLGLERCIQKTANHPVLQNDTDLKLFLESDTFALDVGNSLHSYTSAKYFDRSSTAKQKLHMKEAV
jgi:sorting nexin-1/2